MFTIYLLIIFKIKVLLLLFSFSIGVAKLQYNFQWERSLIPSSGEG